MLESLGAVAGIQVALFASGILLARSLGPTDRGYLAVVLILPEVAAQLVCVGLPSALTYFIARNRPAWVPISRRLGGVAVLQGAVAAVILVGLVEYFLHEDDEARRAGYLAIAGVPLFIVNYYGLHVLQGLGEIRWFNTFRIVPVALFSAGVAVLLIAGPTVTSCTVVWLVAQAVTSMGIAVVLRRRARRDQPRGDAAAATVPERGEMVRFGVTGFLAQVSPVETFRVDTLVVAGLFSPTIVGYYAVAASVSNAPRFIADALVTVAYPHVAEQDDRVRGRASAWRYVGAAAVLCGAAALVLALALPVLIPFLFGDEFEPAVSIGVVLLVAAAVISVRRVALDCLRALGRPGVSTIAEVVSLVALVAMLVAIGSSGDGQGVAAALAIAFGAGLVLVLALLRRRPAAAAS